MIAELSYSASIRPSVRLSVCRRPDATADGDGEYKAIEEEEEKKRPEADTDGRRDGTGDRPRPRPSVRLVTVSTGVMPGFAAWRGGRGDGFGRSGALIARNIRGERGQRLRKTVYKSRFVGRMMIN